MKHDSTLLVKKRDVGKVITKLASYFGVKKDVLKKEHEELGIEGLLYSERLKDTVNFDYCFYVGHIEHLHIDNLIKYSRFKESQLYSEYLNGKGLAATVGGSYIMIFYINDLVFTVREDNSYLGIGGMFVKDLDEDNGFIIEPLDHYLKYNWPKDKDE